MPGVNYAGLIHPGLIGCLPDRKMLDTWNEREMNLLNTDPPFTLRYLDDGDGAGWEARVADPRGRAFNLMAEYAF